MPSSRLPEIEDFEEFEDFEKFEVVVSDGVVSDVFEIFDELLHRPEGPATASAPSAADAGGTGRLDA